MEKAVTGGKPPVHVKHFKNDNTAKANRTKNACFIVHHSANTGGGS